jgi:hypothetical protein
MLLVERYLVYARARSRLQDHLLCTHPSSPSSSFVPCIYVAQGPPESEWVDKDGHDSLECQAVSKQHICFLSGQKHKRFRSPTPFPYCLKCNEDSPNHYKDDCPTPHHGCIMKKCVVPSWHPCSGKYCPVSYQDYSYAMHCASFNANVEDNQFK